MPFLANSSVTIMLQNSIIPLYFNIYPCNICNFMVCLWHIIIYILTIGGFHMSNSKERINVQFDSNSYEQIKLIAEKNHISMSEVVRNWSMQGLNGTLTEQNLDFLIPIIREQLKSIIDPSINRLASLTAKTCIQAGAAAYLSAEVMSKFLPEELAEEYLESYERARKKSVIYARSNTDFE